MQERSWIMVKYPELNQVHAENVQVMAENEADDLILLTCLLNKNIPQDWLKSTLWPYPRKPNSKNIRDIG